MTAILLTIAMCVPGYAQGRGNQPPIPNLSKRPTGSSLGTIRVGAADEKIWFGWHVAVPSTGFGPHVTLSDALEKADALGVTGVVASSTQQVAFEIPKPLDYRLQAGERAAVVRRLKELNQQIFAYRAASLEDGDGGRKVFEFAKALNIPMIVTADASTVARVSKLADEFGISMAVEDAQPDRAVDQARGECGFGEGSVDGDRCDGR